jgi:uncharacterized membrane protein
LTAAGLLAHVARRVDWRRASLFWPHLLAVAFLNVGYHRAELGEGDRQALYGKFLRDPLGATLSDPLAAIRVHHIRDGDELLYLTWAQYMLGEVADPVLVRELSDEKIDLRPSGSRTGPLLPYRDFVFQYPPLSIAPMIAAAAITTQPALYPYAFAALAAAAALIVVVAGSALQSRLGPAEASRTYLWLSALALFLVGVTLETRLDVFAAAAVAVALWGAAADRWIVAGALLAVGAALKLYPGLLVPAFVAPLFVEGRKREAAATLAAFAGTLCVAVLPPVLLGFSGLVHDMGIHARRGVQIESVAATALAWIRIANGDLLDIVRAFGARDLAGGAAPAIANSCRILVLLAALAGGVLAALERHVALGQRIVDGTAAALSGIWIASPVLSPQYLVWGLPAFLLVRSAPARVLYLVALALTRIEYPACYFWVARLTPAALVLLSVRNALLVGAFAALCGKRRWKAA